ncbi:MAG: hypothetical protein MUF42_09135 [Cytophagaceae bacterium]|jgi:hypothetical protein|nr:hypothetical protein [Cytophagaceae bacterium]
MQVLKISEIKKELQERSASELVGICLTMAKYAADNKELLTYLLLEASDEASYLQSCRSEIESMFSEINNSNSYYLKKGLRKVLKTLSKRIRYSGNKETELELYFFFLDKSLPLLRTREHQVVYNLLAGVIKKADKALTSLHEDLQFDYTKQRNQLMERYSKAAPHIVW